MTAGDVQDPPPEYYQVSLRPLYYVLGIWLALALLLGWLDQVVEGAPTAPGLLAERMVELLLPGLPLLIGPVVLLTLLFGLTGRAWGLAVNFGLKIGSFAISALALCFAGLALFAVFIDGENHWEALPWVTPPYLADFLARHPGHQVITYDGTRRLTVHDGKGHRAIVDGDDLIGATLAFEPCPADVGPAQLGGLPLPPKSTCKTMFHVRNPRRELAEFAFEVDPLVTYDELGKHFEDWARREGADSGLSGYRDYRFSATRGEQTWDLWFRYGRNLTTEVYIPRGGHTPPLPTQDDKDEPDGEEAAPPTAPRRP